MSELNAKEKMYQFLKSVDEERAQEYKRLNLEPETVKLTKAGFESLMVKLAAFCRRWGQVK